jgi:phytoene dehydrogenase-like protein
MKAIMIGSGISGLTAAATLAQKGFEVSVFEQFSRAGGVTAPFEQDGFRWDLGQLLVEGFGADEPAGAALAELGVLDQIKTRLDDRGYVFPDFEIKKLSEFGGIRWRMDELKRLFPEDEKGLQRYWRDYLRFTRVMTIARRMEKAKGLRLFGLKARLYLTLLPFLPKKDWSAQRLMDDYFHSEKLKSVFVSILADFFTPPSQFTGLGVFALNGEPSFDKRSPKKLDDATQQIFHYSILGGIGTLVDGLVQKIEDYGGKVFINRPVTKIVVQNNHVTGVIDKYGEFTPADLVIASGGAKETFLKLVGKEQLPADFAARVSQIPLMDSIFMLHLGLDYDPSPYLHGVCTYFYGTYDIEGGIAESRAGIYHEGKAGFVVHLPSLHTPSMAPAGCQAMTIYTICPDRLSEGSWSALKEDYAGKLLGYAGQHIPSLRQHIRSMAILTPDDFRKRTHLDHHAFGGIAPLLGAWKVPHQTPVNGLWFVGAQSESGGGVGAVLTAAYKTATQAAFSAECDPKHRP